MWESIRLNGDNEKILCVVFFKNSPFLLLIHNKHVKNDTSSITDAVPCDHITSVLNENK